MKEKIFILGIFFFISSSLSAQNETDKDIYRNKGYFNITKFGYIFVNEASLETFNPQEGTVLTTIPSNNALAYSLQTINGTFINPYLSLGIGVGLDGYHNPNYNTMPLFFDIRGYLSDSLESLYLFTNYGTLVKIKNGTRNGNTFNIGLGYKIPLNKNRFTIVTDISYSYKAVSNDGKSIRNSIDYTRLKGTMLSIGVIF